MEPEPAAYRVAPRLTARLTRWRRFFCWPRACSLSSSSSSSSSSQSPSVRGRRRTPASAPKPHSCRAFCRGADKPPPLMLHLRLVWFRVSFSRGGADDGAPLPLPLPAAGSCSLDHLTTSPLLLAWTGPLLLAGPGRACLEMPSMKPCWCLLVGYAPPPPPPTAPGAPPAPGPRPPPSLLTWALLASRPDVQ